MATNRDRFALIESISTIGSEASDDLRETLDRIVGAIASSMEVEVCSLYLFDPQHERLVLRATIGLTGYRASRRPVSWSLTIMPKRAHAIPLRFGWRSLTR